jgi:FMN phosphatase YigB (HAD superfamily)
MLETECIPDTLIDRNFSVEYFGIFKPDFLVYQIAVDGLGIRSEKIVFQ